MKLTESYKELWILVFTLLTPVLSFASDIHFVILDEKLYLFSTESRNATNECLGLQNYMDHYSKSNKRSFLLDPNKCSNPEKYSFKHSNNKFELPHGTAPLDTVESLKNKEGFIIEVGDWYPKEIWERYKNTPQDGLCFNTALVESGILTEEHRSMLAPIDYLLGMNVVKSQVLYGETVHIEYGQVVESPLVKNKKTWIFDSTKVEETRLEMKNYIKDNFSSGSIMCLSQEDNQQTYEQRLGVEQYLIEEGFEVVSNLTSSPGESSGGHCFVLLTPNLISEANLLRPKNLTTFDESYDHLARVLPKGLRFHYFQIDNQKVQEGNWAQDQINSDERLKALFELAKKHKELYESLSWNSCDGRGEVNFYDEACFISNPASVQKLRDFWRIEGVVLDSDLFSGFPRTDEEFEESFDEMNYKWALDEVVKMNFLNFIHRRDTLLVN